MPRRISLILITATTVFLTAANAARRTIDDPAGVPHLNERGRAGYVEFLKAETHRAFAVAPGGTWSWRAGLASRDAAMAAAQGACEEETEQRCTLYAVDRDVVFDGRTWTRLWQPYLTAGDAAQAPEGNRRGERFFDLALTDPVGKPIRLSNLRGRAVVLHFWGTWCPSCVKELPQLARLRMATAATGNIEWLFVQVRESAPVARRWLQGRHLALPLYDSGSRGETDDRILLADGRVIGDRSLAPVFPTTYVLDRHGIVVFSMRGSAPDWMQYIELLNDVAANSGK